MSPMEGFHENPRRVEEKTYPKRSDFLEVQGECGYENIPLRISTGAQIRSVPFDPVLGFWLKKIGPTGRTD